MKNCRDIYLALFGDIWAMFPGEMVLYRVFNDKKELKQRS
jgi:hypothetical protein